MMGTATIEGESYVGIKNVTLVFTVSKEVLQEAMGMGGTYDI